jgi:hypothetical protein
MISWRRPNGMRTTNSCTLTQRAFLSPNNNCSSKEAKTMDFSLTTCLIDMSRGGGYECGEYILAIVHCMTLYMYSIIIWPVFFHRKDVRRGYPVTIVSEGIVCTVLPIPPGTYSTHNKSDQATWRASMISRGIQTASLVWVNRRKSPSTWHEDKARTCAS